MLLFQKKIQNTKKRKKYNKWAKEPKVKRKKMRD
jgi:hypothetical protein